ncbi:carbohydrate ABC transporter permease [Ohessyouella blattaphilus]|uniref:Carbohydrate ABC transporter permease n=1 Tax=Ohessyouella blattaphilus TaxID=2949333 RepID=A0ABT1EIB9_9FIRM|nr:carbohydrate ABC transporter permease [Ohessyouella blattaphilus]MCP1109512.1 carbohydrate ABC transporter permease [Ohessyouella blattaphilus]MCR8562906.1 carbohydrate ABC transporter permease [Ohessyouella blattaphilus]
MRLKTGRKLLMYIFFGCCVFVALFPIVWVILSSFKSNAEILSNGISLPSSFDFKGYRDALTISPILKYFFNSVLIAGASTALNVFFLAMAAYVFARCEFRGKNLIYFILSLAMVIPMTALLHPVYNVIQTLGLYDTKMGLIIVYMALNLPMSLLIMRGTFLSVPQALEEAAYVDGASFVRTFFQIMLPCAKGGLTSSAVLAFLGSWNEFTFALMLTSGQAARTLPLSLSYFTAQFSFNYTAMFAAVTIAVIPSILVFAIFQEQVVSSLTAGSVKG